MPARRQLGAEGAWDANCTYLRALPVAERLCWETGAGYRAAVTALRTTGYRLRGEAEMKRRRQIGSLEVSIIGLGGNNFGWRVDAAGDG